VPPAGYSWAQLQVNGLPDTTGAEWLNAVNSYVQNGRTYVRVVGAVDAGGLVVYVGASGNVPDGFALSNDKAFTPNNLVPPIPGALVVDFTVNSTTLSPGETLEFTAKAKGGTAPYQHSVQALNPDSGTITPLGTASTANYNGTWPNVPAGVYLLSDIVTDAAGTTLESATRRLVVSVPGGGNEPVSRTITLAQAQAMLQGSLLLQPWVEYIITGNWNATGTDSTVYVAGLSHTAFDVSGALRQADDTIAAVQVDVAAGTFVVEDYATHEELTEAISTKADLVGGKVPASQLPSYVDDVLEYANLAAFPAVGETGKVYVALDTNRQYRWAGSAYQVLGDSGLSVDQKAGLDAANTSAADPLATRSLLPVAGIGLKKVGNVLSLNTDVSKQYLPAGMANTSIDQGNTGATYPNPGYMATPYLPIDPTQTLSILPLVTQGAWYDANLTFIPPPNGQFRASAIPANAACMRLSYTTAQYSIIYYTQGRLSFVRGLQTTGGTLYPNGQGIVDITSVVGGSAGTDTSFCQVRCGNNATGQTVPLATVDTYQVAAYSVVDSDPGDNFKPARYCYVAPTHGLYEVFASVRFADGTQNGLDYALTVGVPSNAAKNETATGATYGKRPYQQITARLELQQGDECMMNVYQENFTAGIISKLSIRLAKQL
jgi:hypothetical protein